MNRPNTNLKERGKQLGVIILVVLMVGSMVGGYAFAGTAAAAAPASSSDQTTEMESLGSLSDVSTDSQESSSQNDLGGGDIQPQISSQPVNVTTTLQSISVTDFSHRNTGQGRYNISGVVEAEPSKPIAPVGHPVSLELFVYDENGEAVGHDEVNINLNPGSAHPYKLNVSGMGIVDLNKAAQNNTNPKDMRINHTDFDDDGTVEYVVVNKDNNAVVRENGDYIVVDNETEISAVRDPYTSEFGFNVELGKNENYDYELYITAVDGPSDYTSGEDPINDTVNPTAEDTISVSDPASTTSVSSFYNIRTSTEYREESDVTFTTSYKSTELQSEQEIYEELSLPVLGDYRNNPQGPAGTVRSFADATSTNGEYAQLIPADNNRLRVTTSTKSVPSNEPQTLVVRYVAPGDGNITVVPIDSSGAPIKAGANANDPIQEIGYVLPEDPTTKDYTAGANNKTNIAVIQLSKAEQEQLNEYGEFFLSYENNVSTDDEFRLYCQAVVTGTMDRNTSACGLGFNTEPVDDYNNGLITDMSVYPANPAAFQGGVNGDNTVMSGVDPGVNDDSDHVYFEVTVKNAGTEPITNEPVDFFENIDVSFDRKDSASASGFSSFPASETFTLEDSGDGFQGEDVTLTTDLDTGDGTVIVNVTNGVGESQEFVYDGHRGEITERLDGMSQSSTYNVEIQTEMRTGQRTPEVNSISMNAREVGDAANRTQTVSLDPGESQTLRFPASGDIDPTDYTANDLRLKYSTHFYDDNESVIINTDVDSEGVDCDPDCPDPENDAHAVITGPDTIFREVVGSETVRVGTQNVEAFECPDGSGTGNNCGTGSEWELVEENVGYSSGTQYSKTEEQGIPLSSSLIGEGTYVGNTEPLDRGDVQDPYRNLPGDDSEWSVEGYSILSVNDTQSITASEAYMIDEYGSLDGAEEAGWTVSERNVGETVVGYEYDYFRAISSESAVSYDNETVIDRESDEWSRITESQYERGNYTDPLTITRTVAVETTISRENPNNDSYADENWVKTDRVERVVNRNYSAGYDEEYFWSDPGEPWDWNHTMSYAYPYPTNDGYLYTRPRINESYWLYEWELRETREFRLHRKANVSKEHAWVRNFYNVRVDWSRSQSGTLHKYEGPEYGEDLEYGYATGTFSGEESRPAYSFGEITEYEWTINGEPVNTQSRDYSFDTGDRTVLASSTSGSYTESVEFNVSNHANTSEIKYQPSELNLTLDIDDNDRGRITLEVSNGNVTVPYVIEGQDIPADGQMTLNIGDDINNPAYSETYNVTVHGTSPAGNDIPEVRSIALSGDANRGGSAISLSENNQGTAEIGLTVEDNAGYEDTTTKTVEIENCDRDVCNPIDPAVVVTDYSQTADVEAGLANVQARIFNLGYDRDEFYVLEMAPGDVGVGPSQSVTCRDGADEMTASEIHNQYNNWTGLNESEVTDANDPYCVSVERIDTYGSTGTTGVTGTEEVVTVSSTYGGAENVKRVVWEGASTPGNGDTVSFTINPRNNNIITAGENEFTLQLRQLGKSEPESTWTFNVFFCQALNEGGDEVEGKLPINRETRQEGALMCPNLNSDFDNFSDNVTYDGTTYENNTPARDGVDACPYDPGKQEFAVIIGSGDDAQRNCEDQIEAGELGLTWTDFNESPQDASEHMVYYDRYDIVNAPNEATYSSSEYRLQLGYNPRNQTSFTDNNLLAYYPMNEQNFEFSSRTEYVPVEHEYTTDTPRCQRNGHIDCPEDLDVETYNIYNISYDSPGGVYANPAWELEYMDRGDLTTYPYDNLWIAADLSGNNYHAPIFHSKSAKTVDYESHHPRTGLSGSVQNYFYRGDELKVPDRGEDGPLQTSAYHFGTEAFMMPFKHTGGNSYFANNYQQGEVTGTSGTYNDCSQGDDSNCFYPRFKNRDRPMNGPAYNEEIGNRIMNSNEFTISMYVKAGPNVGDGTRRNAWFSDMKDRKFFTFYHWNGKKFGWIDPGESTHYFSLHAQNDAGWNLNSISAEHSGNFHYPRVMHGSHAWPNLPTMIANESQAPLQPTYSEGTGIDAERIAQNVLMTGQSYKSQNAPPEMKSLRMGHYQTIRGSNDYGPGVGWRHIAISVEEGDEPMYYVDGLPYKFDGAQFMADNSELYDGATANDEFDGISGESTMHIVGGGMKKGWTQNFLNDYYISDYRMYDTAMTESQVNEHLVVSDGSYTTSKKSILSAESMEELTVQTSGESEGSKEAVVEDMLADTDPDNMSVSFRGQLNGGEVTITAYPLDDNGNRIDGGDQYVRATYNETVNVGNKTFFGEPRDVTQYDVEIQEFTINDSYDSQYINDCENYKMTCAQPQDFQEIDQKALMESRPLPDFVGTDILFALDNGTINVETAYNIAQHYDDEQTYVVDYRGWFTEPIYYSSGSEGVTLEDWNISAQDDFEAAIDYEKVVIQNETNTLDNNSTGISDEWEIVVEIENREHTHQSPIVSGVGVYTYDKDDDIAECDQDIYRCQTE